MNQQEQNKNPAQGQYKQNMDNSADVKKSGDKTNAASAKDGSQRKGNDRTQKSAGSSDSDEDKDDMGSCSTGSCDK